MQYITKSEAKNQIPYFQYPKFLLGLQLSQNAKLLYMLLYDRARISQKNEWLDELERVSLFVKLDVSKTLYFCCYISSCFDRGYLDQTKLSMASGSDRRCASLTA